MTADGFGEHYMYLGLGHSIGLDVHEVALAAAGATTTRFAQHVASRSKPRSGCPGVFYVRCEDVVVVEADRATPLTRFHYEPNIIE